MRTIFGLSAMLGICLLGCTTPAVAQPTYSTLDTSDCRSVNGQIDVDGVMQPVVGQACRQPDGNWVLVQVDESGILYPMYGSWVEYWPPTFFGGTLFVFDDFHRFHHHHFHHFDHVNGGHVGHPMTMGGVGGVGATSGHGGVGATGGMSGSPMHSMSGGTMHGMSGSTWGGSMHGGGMSGGGRR
ncbi:hypothetical protein [Trinickia fusca]|nr:hypothetical protein [Trinickia fusca]